MGDERLQFDLGGAASPAPIPLAHVAAFTLGPLRVEPARRCVTAGEGRSEQLEPLVMQVLVALASAKGATLSRDDLIAACWEGRVVSDDAINRVTSRLRPALERLSNGAVRLETVPKVGYRLVAPLGDADSPAIAEQLGRSASRMAIRSRWGLAAAALALAGTAAGWAYFSAPSAPETVTVAVEPADLSSTDREARQFASDLTSDLARLAGAISQVDVIDAAPSGQAAGANILVRVSVGREGGQLVAKARLVSAADRSVLWSDDFSDEDGIASRLREQVAVGTAEVMRCGLERSTAMLDDAPSVRLFFAACDAVRDEDFDRAQSFAQQVVDRRPDSAAAWACLAMTTLLAAEPTQSGEEWAATRRRATAYAQRAITLDPHAGRAYLALASAEGADDQRSLDRFEQGLRFDPELPVLHRAYSQSLFNLGYVRASVPVALRGLALDPASRQAYELAVRRLAAADRLDEALALQARAERMWPGHPGVIAHRMWLLPYSRDPKAAVAILERSGTESAKLPPLLRHVLRWRADPDSLDLAAIDAEAEAAFRENPASAWFIVWGMHSLGQDERAFAWLARAPKTGAMYQWSALFVPSARELRRDPRFFAAMARLGLVGVWRKRGRWPDFCAEPGLRYDCRREATRLAAGART